MTTPNPTPPRVRLAPGPALLMLIQIHGSTSRAATAWDVEFRSLDRFLRGTGQLHGDTVARIIESTRLPYQQLFIHAPETQESPQA